MKKLIILCLLIIFCNKKQNDFEKIKSPYPKDTLLSNSASVLNLREKPSLDSPVIAKINKCDQVRFLEETVEKALVDGESFPFYKVEHNYSKVGYASSKYLDKINNIPFSYNNKPFDIIGRWPLYYDSPNAIFTFNDDKTFIRDVYDESGNYKKSDLSDGTYEYDGCCKIIATFSNGKVNVFNVILISDSYKNEKTTLMLECFILEIGKSE
ncbi:SH3 domain-containing protein [Leptospira selangorensis]|uniref:SH3 domain-containing protein n=1 Tax=Leptospira selangorensis TaxID=2484982 RepID=A0ABY2N035_9LEPT|nr:SH3 domain-containing protein [Leptospira selangorensis]TGM13051.1 SH3 domain-containing protein [Leptospira selangorensis]